MSAINTDNAMQTPKDIPNPNPLPPVVHLQYIQRYSGSQSASPVYEGFTFFKAMPKQSATWTCVKRTVMNLNQDEYIEMIQKRADRKPPLQQYRNLSSDTLRAHINQLIDEQKNNNPLAEWSCVYIKEHTKVSKARQARRSDHETVSMDVIIMQRPMKTQAFSRTLMGGSAAIGKPLPSDTNNPLMWSHHRDHHPMPNQNGNILRPILHDLPPHLAPAMSHFARLVSTRAAHEDPNGQQFEATHPHDETSHPAGSRDQLRESARSTATVNNRPTSPAFSATNSSDMSLEDSSDCSSESNSDPDDASMLSDESDDTTATDDLESMETETEAECQKPQPNQASFRQHNSSPYRRESSYGPHSRRKSQSRSLDRRNERNYDLRDQFEVPPVKVLGSRRAEGARSGSVPGKRYRTQLMNDNEVRSRMLDRREESLGHREKWLKRTRSGVRQFDRRQPVRDSPAVCRCTCRCAIKEKKEPID
ncbi:hypothetical protein N7536_006286 [Penicillium majusculum]|uniref:Uncharacterized protein n=1 Tax=Penicillium solitum TaxID=60172 RepID=A0A1V6RR69_9EURO|nr:uncharacterized protein PENSOL_c001G09009 [Penicillium solitum]KAJ5695874.1 hypothetical protein N7536_006286 [Penicillium majusculum]OQE04265.1 hypothetical protein PENSOL_c001G09009 [Penicillium solitum]